MTVGELIERLEYYDRNSEIRLVTQRHCPVESHLLGICDNEESFEQESGTDYRDRDVSVYLVEGENIGCGPKSAWGEAI